MYSVNISIGNKEDRMMITGLHTLTDISCVGCGPNVGWKCIKIVKSVKLMKTIKTKRKDLKNNYSVGGCKNHRGYQ
ncbi:hypothetical protein Bca52824_008394 [Brassica carinata]|uniref:Yippee domain-containing protein n=1 Tax=Brassica carinata TaxID=52824 RepID=A0A8X7W961_BRACI|nr:hypothetical protein Bca52824_008392 [Brassica carinata]KAG2325666.1 hypothetical protein Bca52824_008394 [Brassica carinata]